MADQETKFKQSEKTSEQFDVPSSPYEDYSNMMNNLNTGSDLMQTPSDSPAPPDHAQDLVNFSGDHAVDKHLVNLVDSQQSTGQNGSDKKVPVTSSLEPFDCQKCDVMREIMHTNGMFLTVLSIYGQPGVFYHATLDVYHYTEGFPHAANQTYVDFKNRDFGWIKRFLLNYGAVRKGANYAVIKDYCAPFYDVICSGINMSDNPRDAPGNYEINNEDASSPLLHSDFAGSSTEFEATESVNQNSPISDSITYNQADPASDKVLEQRCMTVTNNFSTGNHEKAKIHIMEQRKRTAEMQPSEITKYFHLPLTEAARELQICSSSLKTICRRHGISRWPQRKIKAIDSRIASLKNDLKSQNSISKVAVRIRTEINRLEEKRKAICSGRRSIPSAQGLTA